MRGSRLDSWMNAHQNSKTLYSTASPIGLVRTTALPADSRNSCAVDGAKSCSALIIFGEVLMTVVTSALNSCRSLVFI